MKYRIVVDSSCNVRTFDGVDFASVPLKICAGEREYVDDAQLNVAQMVEELRSWGGKSGSSCPNVQEWLDAFEGGEGIFAITITSNLSGAWNAAVQAGKSYMHTHENARVCVLDSLSTGPEMLLVMEKLREMMLSGMEFDEIEAGIRTYMQHTHLVFGLQSLTNLARNGRVNPAVAAIAGVLGICVVGKASEQGTLEMMHRCRGEKRTLKTIVESMDKLGCRGGRVRVHHCMNPEGAQILEELIKTHYPGCDVQIGTCKGLCSFYAEKDGFLVGFEDAF